MSTIKVDNKSLVNTGRPEHQNVALIGTYGMKIYPLDAPEKTVMSEAGIYTTDIKLKDLENSEDDALRFEFPVANAAVQKANLFEQIEYIKWEDSSNNQIEIDYGRDMLKKLQAFNSTYQKKYNRLMDGREDTWSVKPRPLQVGTHYQYLPLDFTWLGQTRHKYFGKDADITMSIKWRSGVISGTETNLTLTGVALVSKTANHLLASDRKNAKASELGRVHKANYIKWYEVKSTDTTSGTSAGDETIVSLDGISGVCPGVFVSFRNGAAPPTVINSDNNLNRFLPIGAGTIQLVSGTDHTIIDSSGSPISGELASLYLRDHFPDCDFAEWSNMGIYFIPFSASADQVLGAGIVDGTGRYLDKGMDADGDELFIRYIQSSSPGVAEVHTLTTSQLADSGSYRFAWGSEKSVPVVYNATVSVMKTAIEGMPSFRKRGWSVTCSGTAETTFTVTWAGNSGSPYNDTGNVLVVEDLSLLDGTARVLFTPTVSAYGSNGYIASPYNVRVQVPTVWASVARRTKGGNLLLGTGNRHAKLSTNA